MDKKEPRFSGAGFTDEMYKEAGAIILDTAKEVYDIADMIIKVKEPIECEYDLLRENQILYTYLHLAPNAPLTKKLMEKGVKAVAYETITDKEGNLPCLRPMSQIAGRLSVQQGAKYLGKLILDGNFSVMIPDMYAFMQHAFGHEVTGALKEFEHYSYFWNERNKKEVVAMRSPLTWRSEVNKLTLIQNELTEKWFKYLTSGIVYNVWGCDCITGYKLNDFKLGKHDVSVYRTSGSMADGEHWENVKNTTFIGDTF